MKPAQKALIANLVISLVTAFSIVWIIGGFTRNTGVLDGPNLAALRYYTVDSNILMAVAALAAAVQDLQIVRGRRSRLSLPVLLLKLSGTVSVTLTMMITIFFLGPTLAPTYGFFSLFAGSNFFLHLFNPLCSILTWILLEKTRRIPFRHTPLAVLPTALYAVYYVAVTLAHVENGKILPGYDWYGFFFLGLNSWVIGVPLILLITWGFTLILWKLNRRKAAGQAE